MQTVVVPLDGSEFSRAAIRVARAVARRAEASVQLVRVTEPALVSMCDDYLQEVAKTIIDVPVSTTVVVRQPGEVVADGIKQAVDDVRDGLVCMTAHGRSGLGAALLGTTTEDLIHRLDQPVLVVGRRCAPDWPDQPRLLIPLDGSVEAERSVLPLAAEIARSWNLDPWLIQVAHPFDNAVAEHADHVFDRAEAELRALGVEPRLDFQFASNIALTINGQAQHLGAALIIMASHVHPGAARTVLGSVTMRVIHTAPCPVLVCPPSADGAHLVESAESTGRTAG